MLFALPCRAGPVLGSLRIRLLDGVDGRLLAVSLAGGFVWFVSFTRLKSLLLLLNIGLT